MWLRIDEAAVAMGVSARTVRRWIAAGMPHRRTPSGVRIHSDTLQHWRVLARVLDFVSHSDL